MGKYKGYVAFFYCQDDVNLEVGKKEFRLKKGYYAYVGSCGVHCDKRISRHMSEKKEKKHWHVDYLSSTCTPLGVLILPIPEKEIVRTLAYLPGIGGFGNTDDKESFTHLFCITVEEVIRRLADCKI